MLECCWNLEKIPSKIFILAEVRDFFKVEPNKPGDLYRALKKVSKLMEDDKGQLVLCHEYYFPISLWNSLKCISSIFKIGMLKKKLL